MASLVATDKLPQPEVVSRPLNSISLISTPLGLSNMPFGIALWPHPWAKGGSLILLS